MTRPSTGTDARRDDALPAKSAGGPEAELRRGPATSRRSFVLGGAAWVAAAPWLSARAWAADTEPVPVPDLTAALGSSPYIYVSPLLGSGAESRCHGEIWFAWVGGAAVGIVSSESWKSRAIDRGLTKARIWVGDHGRWKGTLGEQSEAFRAAPSFLATAEKKRDTALLDRVLADYERKYPAEIGRWRDKMRAGHEVGSRVLIRYTR